RWWSWQVPPLRPVGSPRSMNLYVKGRTTTQRVQLRFPRSSFGHRATHEEAAMERRKGLILALCCVAQFMVVLDIAIVNVALPSIKGDLGLSQAGLEWIVIAYGLMLGGFLLLG